MSQRKIEKSKLKETKVSPAKPNKFIIIGGILQKKNKNFICFQPFQSKGETEKTIKLTKETKFLENTFSTKMKLIKEKTIKLIDFKKGDVISIVVEKDKSLKVALIVRRMVVHGV